MTIYLQDIPLDQAKNRLQTALEEHNLWQILNVELIPIDEKAVGRVLAEPVWAILSSPHYHASAMDGFAVRASDTTKAMPSFPVTLLFPDHAFYVDTGDPLPDWADSVIPIEFVEAIDENGNLASELRAPSYIRIRAAATPWQHVRSLGEDIVASQLVLPAGQVLRPVDLGAAAASGHTQLHVSVRPRVAILPTGSELIPIGQQPARGEIIEYNSVVLAGQVQNWGGVPTRYPITSDDFNLICTRVLQAAETSELILLNAGSSAGAEDFSAKVIAHLGEVLIHGVAVRPGHPVIFGLIHHGSQNETVKVVPIIGVPGYPVSAALTAEIFIEPILARWLGRPAWDPPLIQANLTRKVTSPAGDTDYLRVVVGQVGEQTLAAPLARGAGVISSLVKADGIAILPPGTQGLEAGTCIQVRLYRSVKQLEHTIFAIGSHDMTLDLVAQFLAERDRRFVSANVGSQGGLIALRRGEAHLAGCHLLDPTTGEYNLTAIQQYLPSIPVRLMTWVNREQGLLIRRGNPKSIHNLDDLIRPDVTFVNRQHGAGTRILLDYHLSQKNLSPLQIKGYLHEEYTHLGVAAAIASGRADCGLGIPAAASALDLDFVPLYHERYDFVIPHVHLSGDLLTPLFELIQSPKFRSAISALPGYDISKMGNIVIQ
jgi:putative molybdopterin biosynthesis protein